MTIELTQDDVIKLLVALVVGGLIGSEREYRDKAAGFRTIIFICLGSALFTILSSKLAANGDPARIAAQIVTGVGFLGGGAILRHEERVVGLTTAAAIWLTAALGMGAGGGYYGIVGVATVLVMVVLWVFPTIEHVIDRASHAQTYHIVTPLGEAYYDELRALFTSCKLTVFSSKRYKTHDRMISEWAVHGSLANHHRLTEQLFAHPDVIEFRV